jgi:hypothetical protein
VESIFASLEKVMNQAFKCCTVNVHVDYVIGCKLSAAFLDLENMSTI